MTFRLSQRKGVLGCGEFAKICEAHGQRVQKSVFECSVNAVELEILTHKLITIISSKEDSLRIYRLREPRADFLWLYGKQPEHDLHDPLIL